MLRIVICVSRLAILFYKSSYKFYLSFIPIGKKCAILLRLYRKSASYFAHFIAQFAAQLCVSLADAEIAGQLKVLL